MTILYLTGGVSDEMEWVMTDALGDQYKTDDNLRRRQGLFDFVVPPPEPQPDLTVAFDWGPRAVVLDVGCGNGLWADAALRRTPQATLVGVDASAGMASIFAQRTAASAVVGDITRLPARTESADAVLALWMLYHVPDKAAALSEVARVLRPGGFVIAATNSDNDGVLGDLYRAAVERALRREVTAWGPTLDFTVENGAEILRPYFSAVETWVIDTWFEVDRADPFMAVAESMRDAILMANTELDFHAFTSALAEVLDAALADGPIRFARRSGYFRASRPG